MRCYKSYQKLIPNGDRIPHPCGDRQMWGGVGHYRVGGGGARNQFGADFTANNLVRQTSLYFFSIFVSSLYFQMIDFLQRKKYDKIRRTPQTKHMYMLFCDVLAIIVCAFNCACSWRHGVAEIVVLPKFASLALTLCRLSAIAFTIWLKRI